MAAHNDTGILGEEIAAKMLRKKGMKIVERNWRLGHLEVDIIAESRTEIAFVEVKTRTTTWGGKTPAEYVDEAKKRHLTAAADAYVKGHGTTKRVRLDVVGILLHPETLAVVEAVHYENAFLPPMRTIGSGAGIKRARKMPPRW